MARQLHRQARQPEVILGQPDQALRRRAIGGVSPLALVQAGQGPGQGPDGPAGESPAAGTGSSVVW